MGFEERQRGLSGKFKIGLIHNDGNLAGSLRPSTGTAGGSKPRCRIKRKGCAMTKSQTVATLAEKAGVTKAQVAAVLEAQAELAYSEAANGFAVTFA